MNKFKVGDKVVYTVKHYNKSRKLSNDYIYTVTRRFSGIIEVDGGYHLSKDFTLAFKDNKLNRKLYPNHKIVGEYLYEA